LELFHTSRVEICLRKKARVKEIEMKGSTVVLWDDTAVEGL
jgi:hypothetical protein